MIDLSPLAKRIKAAAQITVVTHRRPDGDAVGSALGLAFGIESAYPSKRVTLLCADPIPRRLAFLAHGREMETVFLPFPRPELVIAVDVASGSLLGEMQGQIEDLVDVKLDHHLGGEDFAPLCLVDPTASAAGEMVFDLLSLLDAPQDEEKRLWAMTALYAAIASDCGSFRYSNVTPRTHEIAAALIRAGVDGSAVCHALFESLEAGEVRATRCAYEKLSFHLDGRIALIVVTLEDRKKWQLDEEMLVRILKEPKNSLLKQYARIMEMDGIELQFTEEALVAIAKKAIERKSGARGLRAIIEKLLIPIMYDVSSRTDVAGLIIDEDSLESGEPHLRLK